MERFNFCYMILVHILSSNNLFKQNSVRDINYLFQSISFVLSHNRATFYLTSAMICVHLMHALETGWACVKVVHYITLSHPMLKQ